MKSEHPILVETPNIGCICCSHILNEGRAACIVSHTGGDWAILCDDPSHDKEDIEDDTLSAVHLSHVVTKTPQIAEWLSLPVNKRATKMLKKGWKVSDDIDLSFNPRGGEIVGLSDKEWKKLIVNAQGFWTGKTTEGKVASVTFWTGLRAVPVWTSREAADQKISEHWPTDSVFEIIDRNEFVHKIKKNKIQWVAINFNCNECDTVACI